MITSSIKEIMQRARAATQSSPLAIFNTAGGFDCVFYNTVATRSRVAESPTFVCLVDQTTTRAELKKALGLKKDPVEYICQVKGSLHAGRAVCGYVSTCTRLCTAHHNTKCEYRKIVSVAAE